MPISSPQEWEYTVTNKHVDNVGKHRLFAESYKSSPFSIKSRNELIQPARWHEELE
jgi:hypothetical protein